MNNFQNCGHGFKRTFSVTRFRSLPSYPTNVPAQLIDVVDTVAFEQLRHEDKFHFLMFDVSVQIADIVRVDVVAPGSFLSKVQTRRYLREHIKILDKTPKENEGLELFYSINFCILSLVTSSGLLQNIPRTSSRDCKRGRLPRVPNFRPRHGHFDGPAA